MLTAVLGVGHGTDCRLATAMACGFLCLLLWGVPAAVAGSGSMTMLPSSLLWFVATEKKPKKRQLRVRVSEETRDIVTNRSKFSKKYVNKRLQAVRMQAHKVSPHKANKTYALRYLYDQTTGQDIKLKQSDHTGFFAVTIIVRQLFSLNALLRESKFQGYQLKIKGRFVQQSLLFGRGSDAMSSVIFLSLCHAMGSMHLHNVFASKDTLHSTINGMLEEEKDGAERVRLLSFFFEFAFLVHFVHDADKLLELANLSPEQFANHCYAEGYNPVSPRFGQGKGGKSWHPNLTAYLEGLEETKYIALIVDIYHTKVLTKAEALVVFSICQLPAQGRMSRNKMFRSIFHNTTGYGDFAAKNYLEALMAHDMYAGATQEDLSKLQDGPGATHYWDTTRISRKAMLKALGEHFADMHIDKDGHTSKTICVREIATGDEHLYSLRDLGVTQDSVTEAVLQFWSCAQGRIFDIWNNFLRCKETPVDLHLLHTKTIVDDIKARVALARARQKGGPAAG